MSKVKSQKAEGIEHSVQGVRDLETERQGDGAKEREKEMRSEVSQRPLL